MPSRVSVTERLSPSLTRRRAATSAGRIAPRELPTFRTFTFIIVGPLHVITYVKTSGKPCREITCLTASERNSGVCGPLRDTPPPASEKSPEEIDPGKKLSEVLRYQSTGHIQPATQEPA